MIRTCSKCGAYYADIQLAFCYADGTPLADVDPGTEKWNEGSRSVQEKTKTLRRKRRRCWWRRIALGAMTMVLMALVVSKSFTVETTLPQVKDPSLPPSASALPTLPPSDSVAPSPFPSRSASPPPSPSPSLSTSPSPTPSPSPSPSASPSPSPSQSPIIFYKISGRVISASQPLGGVKVTLEGSKLTSTTTDANGYYTFSGLRASGDYTITPRSQMSFNPSSRSFNNLRRDESADFVALVKVKEEEQTPARCSDSEREHVGASLIARFSSQWRRKIEQERSRIIARTFGVDVQNAVATLGPIEFQSAFTTCSAGVIRGRYAWQVKADLPQGLKTVAVPGMKTFSCGKVLGAWFCN